MTSRDIKNLDRIDFSYWDGKKIVEGIEITGKPIKMEGMWINPRVRVEGITEKSLRKALQEIHKYY